MNTDFDDIRPYTDQEIPAAMQRIADSSMLPILVSYVFPDMSTDEIKQMLCSFKTIKDFQMGVMYHVNRQVISQSISEFTFGGLEQLEKGKPYLFVSNHRDIMLDASLLQNVLVGEGLETSQITFGANLMMNPLVIDIGKSNKMFKVERPGGNAKDFYKGSLHLSQYIRNVIVDEKESVWIAQRNGRTKDGNDKTDHGLISMFMMSGDRTNLVSNLVELNITPISTSYEYEPCAMMKARESYLKERDGVYVKKPMEDMDSIVSGIKKKKGTMNIAICPTITYDELKQYEGADKHEIIKAVADMIDERIYANYRLYPNNYIAYDWLSGTSTFKKYYTQDDKDVFKAYCDKIFSKLYEELGSEAEPRFTEILLGIYAIPVNNKFFTTK